MNLTDLNTHTDRMPMLFVGHGSPMNAFEENEFTSGWRLVAGSLIMTGVKTKSAL